MAKLAYVQRIIEIATLDISLNFQDTLLVKCSLIFCIALSSHLFMNI